jgi:hypothetical protein
MFERQMRVQVLFALVQAFTYACTRGTIAPFDVLKRANTTNDPSWCRFGNVTSAMALLYGTDIPARLGGAIRWGACAA